MKFKLDLHGVVFEYERKPLPEGRFRRLCVLAAIAAYVCLVVGVTALCGFCALLVMVIATLLVLAFSSI